MNFSPDIDNLNVSVVRYMLDVDAAFFKLTEAVRTGVESEYKAIIVNDAVFNRTRDALETECLKLFLKKQRYARELRNLLSVFKITTEIERVADQIRDVAENLVDKTIADGAILKAFVAMLESCRQIFDAALRAFGAFDTELCRSVRAFDDKVDKAYLNMRRTIQNAMKIDINDVWFSLLSAVKHAEKIGDHAVNIAEWTYFTVTGERKMRKLNENRD